MQKLYERIDFVDNSDPALNATNLNLMSKGIDDLDNRMVELASGLLEVLPQLRNYLEQSDSLISALETLSTHPPYIGANGNWWVWDTNTDGFIDSQIDASITVNIADITSIDFDESPYITNSGTNTDPVFHLFIPRAASVFKIEKTKTENLVDTYTITFKDGFTSTFNVTNGTASSLSTMPDTDISSLEDGQILIYNIVKHKWENKYVDLSTKMNLDGSNATNHVAFPGALTVGNRADSNTGDNSVSEGAHNKAIGECSHAEGLYSNALGNYSHAEGYRSNSGVAELWLKYASDHYVRASALVVYNNEIHCLGGINDKRDHYKWNSTDGWVSVSTLPLDVSGGRAVVYNDEIHLFSKSSHYKWNSTDGWVSVSTLPFNSSGSVIVVYDNEIHLIGGQAQAALTSHYKWNSTDGWVSVSTLPVNIMSGLGVVYDDEIHCIDYDYIGQQNVHYKWDRTSWTLVENPSIPQPNDAIVVFNNKIHVIGGLNDKYMHYAWDGTAWEEYDRTPYNFQAGKAIVYQNKIHIIGGLDNEYMHYAWDGNMVPFDTYSHAEGYATSAIGNAAHSEGANTCASGNYSHAQGKDSRAQADYSCAIGNNGRTYSMSNELEGTKTKDVLFGIGSDQLSEIEHTITAPNNSEAKENKNCFSVDEKGNVYMRGAPYVVNGLIKGRLIANPDKVTLEDGAIYQLHTHTRLNTGAYRGQFSYLISACFNPADEGLGTTTTGQALPQISNIASAGTVGCNLSRLYEAYTNRDGGTSYHSVLGIGSCATNCYVRYTLTKVSGSNEDFGSNWDV